MIRVALTGNIGMGKTTAAKIFRSYGAFLLNTDDVVKELLNKDFVITRVCDVFGRDIAKDGHIDKKTLAEIVFKDDKKLRNLEDILHPLVFEEVERFLSENNSEGVFIVEAPVLFERGYQRLFDKTITVFCDENVAIKRLVSKGFSTQDAISRLQSQMPIDKKCGLSDFVINNNGSIEELKQQVFAIYQKLERMADGRGKGDF